MLTVMMASVCPLPTTAVPVVIPMMVNGVPNATMSLGASLRDRATLPSPLRGLGPSGGYPSRLRSLTLTPRSAWQRARHAVQSSRTRCRHRPRHPRAGAMRRARHRPRFARPRRRHRPRASLRLVAPALRASPVPASPRTGLRTTPCSGVRMTADSAVAGSGSMLRTTAPGSGRIARHSFAVAAPLRRVPRRRFPHRSSSGSWLSGRPSAFRAHTRRISDAEVAVAAHDRDWLIMPRSLAHVSAPGVPEILPTDRCSQTAPGCAIQAAPSRPCRAEHLSGFCRATAGSLEFSCKHL